MPDQQYDNSNRGAAWPTKAVKGKLDVGGKVFYIDIVQTGRDAPAPVYNLYATSAETRILYGTGLFTPKKADSKSAASGVLDLDKEGGEQWINLFVNHPVEASPNKPVVRLTAQPKDPTPAQAPQQGDPMGDGEPLHDPGPGGFDPNINDGVPF